MSTSWRIDYLDTLEPLEGEWRELANQGDNIFATWEWVKTWWRHFGKSRRLYIARCYDSQNNLVSLIPLYLARTRPIRLVRLVGNGVSDEQGPVCSSAAKRHAPTMLDQAIWALPSRWDIFLGENLPDIDMWNSTIGGEVIRREGNPALRSEGIDWEGFLSRASRNLRQQVRRRERNVERAHQLRYRLADDQDRLDYDMDLLFSLHAARWGAVKRGFQTVHAFHREFATLAFNRGWLRLWFLELDGAPAAAWYGFRFGTVESYYQAGRDLRYEHLSIGSVLLAHSIREALNDGMHEYRFLRGGEDYKYRFAHEDHVLGGIALPATVRGRAAIRAVLTLAGAKWARPLISRSV